MADDLVPVARLDRHVEAVLDAWMAETTVETDIRFVQ